MGGFSILGEVARGFDQSAQVDQQRKFAADQQARASTTKMFDELIASENVPPELKSQLAQRRIAIASTPYGKKWDKHADLSNLQMPTPPPQTVAPATSGTMPLPTGGGMQPPSVPPAGGAAGPPAPPSLQSQVAALPVARTAPSYTPEATFQPPAPPPGLQFLSPEQVGAQKGAAGAASEKALYEARLKQAQQLGLTGVEAAQYASGRQVFPAGRYNSIQTWEDSQGNPIPVLVNRAGGGATGINGEPLPEGAHPVTGVARNVIAQLPDGTRQPAFENKFGQITDGQGNILTGAVAIPTAAIPTTRTSSSTFNAETGNTTSSSTSQKAIGGGGGATTPAAGVAARPAATGAQGTPSKAPVTSAVPGKAYGAWTAPRLTNSGFSVSGGLPDVIDDVRKGSAVATMAWNWANLGIKPPQKAQYAVDSYMGRHGLEAVLEPSAQARSRAAAAEAMLPLLDRIKQEIVANRSKLGVLPGRVAEAERVIGNLDPALAELYGNLKSVYSLSGTAHGWRAIQVATEFEKAFGGLHTNPDTLLGGMKAQEDFARGLVQSAGGKLDAQRGGLASPSAPPSSAPSPATHIFDLKAWQQANPNGDSAAAIAAAKAQGYEVKQ